MENFNTLKHEFMYPSAKYRSAPFWSWNDKLDAGELVRQVKDMKDHGMGGFFMHSREGLETEYMGKEWMECIKETAKAAEQAGMSAWIYDEDRWPSGAAGGLVPAKGGDDFRAKGLTIEVQNTEFASDDRVVALFRANIQDMSLISCEKIAIESSVELNDNEVFLSFRREVSGPSEWFNDDAYADNLNPDAVKAFIQTRYDVYKNEVGEYFGKSIPGVFTDEPNISDSHCSFENNRSFIPWTDGFHQK